MTWRVGFVKTFTVMSRSLLPIGIGRVAKSQRSLSPQHIPGFGTIRGIPTDSGSAGWGPCRGRGRGRGKALVPGPSYNNSEEL